MEFTIKKQLTQELLETVLCGALEGGSNYWYYLGDIDSKHFTKGVPLVDNLAKSFFLDNEYALKVYDIESVDEDEDEDNAELLGEVNASSIIRAFELLEQSYPQAYHNIMNENEDADDCDIWFQLAVMGDVVYG
jgi:hypothetical protein